MANPIATVKTNHGDIRIELYEDKAPITAKNFATLIEKKFYDGVIFHRVIDGGTTRHLGDDLHEWQPRVRGLVSNDFEYSWNDMLNTLEWAQLTMMHCTAMRIPITGFTHLSFRNSNTPPSIICQKSQSKKLPS
jgi:hypothetical protein